jgi:hypothetical protein
LFLFCLHYGWNSFQAFLYAGCESPEGSDLLNFTKSICRRVNEKKRNVVG